MAVYILYGFHFNFGEKHEFIEIFSSLAKVNQYLVNHPEITKQEIAIFDIDPN